MEETSGGCGDEAGSEDEHCGGGERGGCRECRLKLGFNDEILLNVLIGGGLIISRKFRGNYRVENKGIEIEKFHMLYVSKQPPKNQG